MADVQGSALCPGSTPGAPPLLSGFRRGILYSGVRTGDGREDDCSRDL